MTSEDLIFLIRHDRAKVNRLRTYLSWKDVRKNAKDTGGNDGAEEILEEPSAGWPDFSPRKSYAQSWNIEMTN